MLGAPLLLFALVSVLSPSDGLASDIEQLLRIEKVIEFDREKLTELKADVSKRQALFEQLADGMRPLEADLAQSKARLDQIAETGDLSERSNLEAEISGIETELELFETQSELAFSSFTTIRDQMRALEKKLEREQRALDAMSGVAPEEAAAPATATPSTPQLGVPPSAVPVLPGVPPPTSIATPAEPLAPVETTAQIEALRELERSQRDEREAQRRLVEFVKRNESLEEQIALEGELLETAQGSVENLTRVLEKRRGEMEGASSASRSRFRTASCYRRRPIRGALAPRESFSHFRSEAPLFASWHVWKAIAGTGLTLMRVLPAPAGGQEAPAAPQAQAEPPARGWWAAASPASYTPKHHK